MTTGGAPELADLGAELPATGIKQERAPKRSGSQKRDGWARWLTACATLVCLLFISGLMDTRLLPLPVTAFAPPPPTPEAERDGRVLVEVVDGVGCKPLPQGDAGAAAGVAPGVGTQASIDCSQAARIQEATVRLYLRLGDAYYASGEGVTNAEGLAELSKLPRGVTWVLVEAPGFARSSAQLVIEGPEATDDVRRVRVVLEPAQSVSVTVVDEANVAIEGATLLASGPDPLPHGGLTDGGGVYSFTRLGAPPWTIKASARGYESTTQSGVTGDLRLTLRRLGSLSVRVVDVGGGPAAGASVLISGSSLWPARRAETDAAGVTLISGLLAGSYDIRAEKGGAVSHTLIATQLARGEHAEVTIQLLAGRMVKVLVTGGPEDSAPVVSGADVVLTEFGLSSFPLQGTTGADGTVSLGPIAPGPATVSARAAGYVARGGVPVPEAADGVVRVSLLEGATLVGLVVDSDGNPIDGASIEIIGTDVDGMPVAETPQLTAFRDAHFAWALAGPSPLIPSGELGVMPGPIPPIPKEWPPASTGSQLTFDPARESDYTPWVTGLDGRFTARPVTPGRLRALVRHPAYVEGISEAVVLAPGGRAEVEVVLKAGGTLEGKVVDDAGYAVSGARVDIVALEGTLERTTITASDGSFAFAAVPDRVQLSVYREGDLDRIAVKRLIEVPEGKRKEVEIVLPAPREPVRIRIETGRGEPVELAQVTVLSLDPDQPLRSTLFTNERGELAVEDARGLPLSVIVSAPGFARLEQSFSAAAEELKLTLEPAVIAVGRITAVRGRRSVEGANVVLVSGGEQRSALTDSNGNYRISDVTPGPARLLVSHPEFARAERSLSVERTERSDRPFELPTIDLSAPGDLEGQVVDPQGNPVAGARVALDVAPAFLPVGSTPAGVAVTDGRGQFALRGVAAGSVTVEAYSADVGRGRAPAEVSEGGVTRGVRIVLSEPAGEAEPAASGSVAVTLGERDTDDGVVVVIVHVASGSEAERAGLLPEDIIDAVDGVLVDSMTEARSRMSGPVRGDVILRILRGETERSLRVRREQIRR